MKKQMLRVALALFVLISLVLGSLWPAMAQEPEAAEAEPQAQETVLVGVSSPTVGAGEFKAGELVVRFREAVSTGGKEGLRAIHAAAGAEPGSDGLVELWAVPEGRELEIMEQLNRDPLVEYAEPNYLYRAFLVPNDPYFGQQWAHTLIRTPAAWDITTGSSSITIAIVDSGIDENHPDLLNKIVAGYDFSDGDSNPHDLNGHGTHVAGIAAAASNNATGIAGVNWQARIMPVRVLGMDGTGYNFDISEGIRWAYQHGAKVINLSLGGPDEAQNMRDAVNEARSAGSLVVAAMGNSREEGNPTSYPAAYDSVMAVAATGPSDVYAFYSQYGPHCDISAPGGDMAGPQDPNGIYSSLPTYPVYMTTFYGYNTNYDYVHGTSQAAPHVSGLAALIWSIRPDLSVDQVRNVIQTTAKDLGAPGWDSNYGYGRIDALAALRAISPPAAPTLSPISNPDGDGSYLVDWNDVSGVTGYTLQEDDSSSFASPSVRYTGANSQFGISGQGAGTWYYRVLASSNAGNSPWSNIQSVLVKPAAPTLQAINNPGGGDQYDLRWSAPAGAAGYRLQEADNPSFSSARVLYVGTALVYRVTGQPGGTWYYRVQAYNPAGDSSWSNAQSTTVNSAALGAPNLQPINNDDGNGQYQVQWSAVSGADSYMLQQSRSPYFETTATVYTGPATQFTVTNQPGGTWYYRVRATGPAGSSPWSNQRAATVTARTYLPFVARNWRTGQPGGDLVNGNFEAGATGWTTFSQLGRQVIRNSGFPFGVAPHGGSWAAWLGGADDEVAYLKQQVMVPSGRPILKFWYWVQSNDWFCGSAYDTVTVMVNSTVMDSMNLCSSNSTLGWVSHTMNLSGYAGQSIWLQIQVATDFSLVSSFFLDDFSFQAAP